MKKKAIILAAGKGSRMKSDTIKVLHKVGGKTVLQHVVDTVLEAGVDELFIVVGHQGNDVQKAVQHPQITYVEQSEQLGTGHAVMQVTPYLGEDDEATVIVLAGDCPLIELATIQKTFAHHSQTQASATILSAKMPDPASYGRILRDASGNVLGIKEAKDCSPEELKIDEINTGIYTFIQADLKQSLDQITTNNQQNEYYLTDTIHILKEAGKIVGGYCTDNPNQAIGINTRMDLADSTRTLYDRTNQKLMEAGVTLVDPKTVYIDSTVTIGTDTIIEPHVVLKGNTRIGSNVNIGPFTYLVDTHVPDYTEVSAYTRH